MLTEKQSTLDSKVATWFWRRNDQRQRTGSTPTTDRVHPGRVTRRKDSARKITVQQKGNTEAEKLDIPPQNKETWKRKYQT